jgi:MarR family transcriptional regulator, 2-MHQ and catechol-resistance regulon repressor
LKTTKKYGKKIDLALSTWVKLARAYNVVERRSIEDIRKYGLTGPQFGVLECLGHLGPLHIGVLSKKQLATGGNMTVVVDNLEKEGLIERVNDPDDRRVTIVRLTTKGRKLFDEIFLVHARYMTEIFSVLSEEEQLTLSHLLKKLGTATQVKK